MPANFFHSIIILMVILTIPSIQAMDNSSICQETFYWIISHMDSNNEIIYQDEDLELLNNITHNQSEAYIQNYSDRCDSFGLNIPTKRIPEEKTPVNITNQCNLDINASLLGFISLDSYFPPKFEGFVIGNISCQTINSYKYIVKYKRLDNLNYAIQGFKTWWVIVIPTLLFMILLARLILLAIRNEKKFNRIKI